MRGLRGCHYDVVSCSCRDYDAIIRDILIQFDELGRRMTILEGAHLRGQQPNLDANTRDATLKSTS